MRRHMQQECLLRDRECPTQALLLAVSSALHAQREREATILQDPGIFGHLLNPRGTRGKDRTLNPYRNDTSKPLQHLLAKTTKGSRKHRNHRIYLRKYCVASNFMTRFGKL
jgi:hypothetical protein